MSFKVIARVSPATDAEYVEKNFGFFDDFETARKFADKKANSLIENINLNRGYIAKRYKTNVNLSDVTELTIPAVYFVNVINDGVIAHNVGQFIILDLSA